MQKNTNLILVAIRGQFTKIVFGPAPALIIAGKKKQLTDSGNWIGWKFQIRTESGYKAVPILKKKLKTLKTSS